MLAALVLAKAKIGFTIAINSPSVLASTVPGPVLYNDVTLWKDTVLLVMKEVAAVSLLMGL